MPFWNFYQVIIYIRMHAEMPEGQLTKLRASMVCEPALAYCARSYSSG